ncbi:Prefoldin [Nannochloropsis oceanica]
MASSSQQSPSEVIALLQAAVKDKDATLAQLKTKTKIFVQEMRGELNQAKAGKEAAEQKCATLKAQLQRVQPSQQQQQQQQQHPGEEGSEGNMSSSSSSSSSSSKNNCSEKVEVLQIQKLQAQLSKAQATVKQTQEEMAIHKQQSHALMSQLAEAQRHQKDAEALGLRVDNLQEEVKMAKEQHRTALNELAEKEKEVLGLDKLLKETMAAAAEAANASIATAAVHEKEQQAQSKRLQEVQQQLEEEQQRFEQQKQRLEKQYLQMQQQQQQLLQIQQARQETVQLQAPPPASSHPTPSLSPQQDEEFVGDLIDFDVTDRVSPLPPLSAHRTTTLKRSNITNTILPTTASFIAGAECPVSNVAPTPEAVAPAAADQDTISHFGGGSHEVLAYPQANEEELAAARADVARLLQSHEADKAALDQLRLELTAAKEEAAAAAAAAAATTTAVSTSIKKGEETDNQEERGMEGLDGPTQHLKAQLLERELTVKEKSILLERYQITLATLTSERDSLQQQVGALLVEKEGLVAAVEKLTTSSSTLEASREEFVREGKELKEECAKVKADLMVLEKAQRTHDDQVRSIRHEAEETVKRVKSDAETELRTARFSLQEAEKAQGQAEKTAANLRAQMEGLHRFLTQGTEENRETVAALEKERGQLTAELELERENGQERRRQMKQYLETLTKEKQEREAELAVSTTALAAARREQGELEEMVQALQERLAIQVETNEGEVRRLEERLLEEERRHAETLADKDVEIGRLREEQITRLSSTARRSEEMENQLKAVEAETAAHKQKRLAAKNEMISLAQALEDLTTTSRLMEESMEQTLIPRCLEQLSLLDRAIDQVDAAAWQLARRGPGGGGGEHSSLSTTRTMGADGRTQSRILGVEMGRLNTGVGGRRGGRGNGGGSKRGLARARSSSGDRLLRKEEDEEEDKIDHDAQLLSGRDKGIDAGNGAGGGRDHRAQTKSMLTMERLARLDVETGRVSAGVQMLAHSLERMQRALEALTEEGFETHSSAHDVVSLCSKVLGECFSFMRQTTAVNVAATVATGAASSSSPSYRGQRSARMPYEAVLREEEENKEEGEEDRVIDVV